MKSCAKRLFSILSPLRLPFRHAGQELYIYEVPPGLASWTSLRVRSRSCDLTVRALLSEGLLNNF